jgi:hypothetical protein
VRPARLEPPGYPDVVKTDEDRERFARLYDDLVRVTGLAPAEALLNAANQFLLGFDVRGAFEKRKRRKRVVTTSAEELRTLTADDDDRPRPPTLDPPGT